MIRSCWIVPIVAAALSGGAFLHAQSPERHKLVVKFDYDFDKNPACPPGYQPQPEAKKKKKAKSKNQPPSCVDLFNVYDISNGTDEKNKYFLFSVPLPENPVGVKHVAGSTAIPNFQPGRHKIAVGAHSPDFGDSDLNACWVIVKITPEDLAPISASGAAAPAAPENPLPGTAQANSAAPNSNSSSSPPQKTSQGPRRSHPPSC